MPSQNVMTLQEDAEGVHAETPAQKRKTSAVDEQPLKQPRKGSPPVSIPALASSDGCLSEKLRDPGLVSVLSEQNLRKLEKETSDRGLQRTPSWQGSLSDLNHETASTRSQSSGVSNGTYRYRVLHNANIFVRPGPPPERIQSQCDVLFKRKVTEERRCEISAIAKKTSQEFFKTLHGAHGEDDLVELIYDALREHFKTGTLIYSRKADWNPSLKPQLQPKKWHFEDPSQTHEANDVIDRPSKQRQGSQSLISPEASKSSVPPPAAPFSALSQVKQGRTVKTPRPNLTIGLRDSAIVEALVQRGLPDYEAARLLDDLQCENRLCSNPTQNVLGVRFPILVIEGKSYPTGKTLFEAQNQAAVSGSCLVNLQERLLEVSRGLPNGSNLKGFEAPLAFSICTEGPVIELWVHHRLVKGSILIHYMNILKICYGSLEEGLQDLLVQLDSLMSWYKDIFLEWVVDQLFKLASSATFS